MRTFIESFTLLREILSELGQHLLGSSSVTSNQLCTSWTLVCSQCLGEAQRKLRSQWEGLRMWAKT